MRSLLLLAVPFIWGMVWFFIRVLMNQRAAADERRRQEETIDGTPRPAAETAPPDPVEGPPCQRHNLHLFLRMFGAERSCRHCAEVRRQWEQYESEQAVREAERFISPKSPDNEARHS